MSRTLGLGDVLLPAQPVPPIVVNVPPAEGLPGWVAPLAGLLGVLVGLYGNNRLTRSREERQFQRDKRLELYLDLLAEVDRSRRFGWLVPENDFPDFGKALNDEYSNLRGRHAELDVRSRIFASRAVYDSFVDYRWAQEDVLIGHILHYKDPGEHEWPDSLDAGVKGRALTEEVERDLGLHDTHGWPERVRAKFALLRNRKPRTE